MSSFHKVLFVCVLLGAQLAQAQSTQYPGIGRAATAKEIAAWDIDVRPDFKGLPKGSGTVAKGMDVWEGKCASCHGVFGEANQVFSPITGGTTKEDLRSGRAARLTDPAYPGRTTLMKLANLSTLWDYINRAMPWTAPKTLSVEEVYAVTAYVLHLGGVLPETFTLSDQNMAKVQGMLPNRNGMSNEHAMWPGAGFGNLKPDVQASPCMKDCIATASIASSLPDFARNAHGNLAEQNRIVGAQLGVDTSKPSSVSPVAAILAANTPVPVAPIHRGGPGKASAETIAAALAMTQKYACVACHGMDTKILGPGFRELAKKYGSRPDGVDYLAAKIKSGSVGVWGTMPMPPQDVNGSEAKALAQWLMDGAKK